MNEKIIRKLFIFFMVLIGCTSCTLNYDSKTGSICLRNESENNELYIQEVYVKEKENNGFERIWSGNLVAGSSEFITVDEGSYSVKIVVSRFGFLYELNTGYNIYKKVCNGDCVYVCFDGNGIFFEE